MIDAAIASGDEKKVATVIGLARSTWPEERSTIDAINDQWKITLAARRAAEAEAERTALINADMFDRWTGEGELGAFQSSGNTESVGVAAALRLDREGIDWTHSIRLRADYQRQNGSTSREQFAASYEPRWQFDENIFAYGLAQYERDRIQGFSSRYSVSGGLGYRILDNPKLKLSLKAGPAYRVTDFTDGTSADRLAGLVGIDFDWQMLDRLKLTVTSKRWRKPRGNADLRRGQHHDQSGDRPRFPGQQPAAFASFLQGRVRQQSASGVGRHRHADPCHPHLRLLTMSERFAFTIDATDGAARTGSIAMRRGTIRTPACRWVRHDRQGDEARTVRRPVPTSSSAIYHLMLCPGGTRRPAGCTNS